MSAIERFAAIAAAQNGKDSLRAVLLKARAEEAGQFDHGLSFEAGGYRVEILATKALPEGIWFRARAFYNDRQLGFGPDGSVDVETFRIVNPPLLVPVLDGPLVIGARHFIESPQLAVRSVLLDMVKHGQQNAEIVKGKIGRTTYTIFGNTTDGRIQSSSTVYATARAGSNFAADTAAVDIIAGQTFDGSNRFCYEGFIDFTTSVVAGSVSAATLSLWTTFNHALPGEGETDFNFRARRFDYGTLTTADWIAGADLSARPLLASTTASGMTADAYTALTSDVNFLTNINQAGDTGIILCSSRHEGNNGPTVNEYVEISSANEAGTTQDPKLVVIATAAASRPVFRRRFRTSQRSF